MEHPFHRNILVCASPVSLHAAFYFVLQRRHFFEGKQLEQQEKKEIFLYRHTMMKAYVSAYLVLNSVHL